MGPKITVRELIERLSTFDGDLPVLVNGYEGGTMNPKSVRHAWVAWGHGTDYCGDHGDDLSWGSGEMPGDDEFDDDDDIPLTKAVLISRH